ncbi:PP2C family protein-serine/threonine phosphatase [Paenibacillus sp. RC67]|uniref:PP2C family protein-serine/threonine phosphatase n=1 Tax=Paenibacillus sp. RC67 TaxID=3039392 RepID=UPI0024AD56BB|nr:PP2C family protein-serine/threonine phosphatase [Paenibacillus sp. RC67]
MLNDYVLAVCILPSYFFITLTVSLLVFMSLCLLLHIRGCREHSEYSEMEQLRRSDLELSKRIQQSVLPKPVQNAFIVIKGLHVPSGQVSGDTYMWTLLQEHSAWIILMDVMGHGVSSSFVSMYMQAFMQSLPPNLMDPKKIMNRLNTRLCELMRTIAEEDAMYCTAVCIRADALRKRVEYVNAGHPYGIMLGDDDNLSELSSGGLTLGIDAKAVFVKAVVPYRKKARIVLFTDGLFEVYGSLPVSTELRMKQLLQACSRSDTDCFMGRLEGDLQQAANKPDDISVIVLDLKDQTMRSDSDGVHGT